MTMTEHTGWDVDPKTLAYFCLTVVVVVVVFVIVSVGL